MVQLLEEFKGLPDYWKCKQLKFNVGEVMFMSLLSLCDFSFNTLPSFSL